MTPERLPDYLQRRIEVAPDGCWLWTGALQARGYGQIELREDGKRRAHLAHRLVYRLLVGDPGENLHHRETCPKRCVNPDHLTPLTIAEHTAHHFRKERCKRGHDLNDCYLVTRAGGRVVRQCRRCCIDRAVAGKRRQRAAA